METASRVSLAHEDLKFQKISLERELIQVEEIIAASTAALNMQPDPKEIIYSHHSSRFEHAGDEEAEKFFTEEEYFFRETERKTLENIASMSIALDALRLRKTSIDQESFLQDEYALQMGILSEKEYLKAENREHAAVLLSKEMRKDRMELNKARIELKKNQGNEKEFWQAEKNFLEHWGSQWRVLNQRHREERGKSAIESMRLMCAYLQKQLKFLDMIMSNVHAMNEKRVQITPKKIQLSSEQASCFGDLLEAIGVQKSYNFRNETVKGSPYGIRRT